MVGTSMRASMLLMRFGDEKGENFVFVFLPR